VHVIEQYEPMPPMKHALLAQSLAWEHVAPKGRPPSVVVPVSVPVDESVTVEPASSAVEESLSVEDPESFPVEVPESSFWEGPLSLFVVGGDPESVLEHPTREKPMKVERMK
jgi:hypothetical protein